MILLNLPTADDVIFIDSNKNLMLYSISTKIIREMVDNKMYNTSSSTRIKNNNICVINASKSVNNPAAFVVNLSNNSISTLTNVLNTTQVSGDIHPTQNKIVLSHKSVGGTDNVAIYDFTTDTLVSSGTPETALNGFNHTHYNRDATIISLVSTVTANNKKLLLVDTSNFTILHTIDIAFSIKGVAFHPLLDIVAVTCSNASDAIQIYNTSTGARINGGNAISMSLTTITRDPVFTENGSKLVMAGGSSTNIYILDTTNWNPLFTTSTGYVISSFAVKEDTSEIILLTTANTYIRKTPFTSSDILTNTIHQNNKATIFTDKAAIFEVSGSLTESHNEADWEVYAIDNDTKVVAGKGIVANDGSFTIPVVTNNPVTVVVYPPFADVWESSTNKFSVGDRMISPTPTVHKQYYKCTTAGVTGAVIPTFPNTGTFNDGTVVWETIGNLVHPAVNTPVIPTTV